MRIGIFKSLLLTGSMAATLSLSAQEVNDQNTPLHLMQPQYSTPYGVPSTDELSAVEKRVVRYLDTAMPWKPQDNRLPKGSFRLTSYEAGVLYAACLSSDNAETRAFAMTNRAR